MNTINMSCISKEELGNLILGIIQEGKNFIEEIESTAKGVLNFENDNIFNTHFQSVIKYLQAENYIEISKEKSVMILKDGKNYLELIENMDLQLKEDLILKAMVKYRLFKDDHQIKIGIIGYYNGIFENQTILNIASGLNNNGYFKSHIVGTGRGTRTAIGFLTSKGIKRGEKLIRDDKKGFKINKIKPTGNKVFIVHGSDTDNATALEAILRDVWGIEGVILYKQPNKGNFVIEKFERLASECAFALVLFTPDDKVKLKDESGKFIKQPRLNVLFELGWFYAQIGRENTLIVLHKSLEKKKNSDLEGSIHASFEESVTDENCLKEIKKELIGAGII